MSAGAALHTAALLELGSEACLLLRILVLTEEELVDVTHLGGAVWRISA